MDINNNGIDDFSFWNIRSVLNHISEKALSFIILLFVFFIIYTVDRLSNYNIYLMSIQNSIPIQMPLKKQKGKNN